MAGSLPLNKEERNKRSFDIAEQFLEILQKQVNAKVDEMTPGDCVYIATDALARCLAIVVAGQMPVSKLGNVEKMLKILGDHISMYAEDIIKTRQEEGDDEEATGDDAAKSPWDAED